MACTYPIRGFRAANGGFTTNRSQSPTGSPLVIPCGGCISCRLAKSRDWATRMKCEAQLHDDNTFLTLTYSDEQLPDDYGIHLRHLQLFIKRLRRAIEPTKIRYFGVGEYGETNLRPHYHLILFGYGFPDRMLEKKSPSGHMLYTSDLVRRLWADEEERSRGYHWVGNFSTDSAAYVARYTMKKIGGAMAADHYQRLHPLTGEISHVCPEFAVMSKRPGIGSAWFDKFERDCFPSDFMVIDANKVPVPKFFDKKLKARVTSQPSALIEKTALTPYQTKRKARTRTEQFRENNTPERLATRAEVARLRASQLKREL